MPPKFNPGAFTFPEDHIFDLHDLAGILLNERAKTEPRFKHAQLFDVRRDAEIPEWTPLGYYQASQRCSALQKVAYILKTPADPPAKPVEPETFLHSSYNTALSGSLSPQDRELIYWRVKHHDSGYKMAHAMQLVLDSLPDSSKLRLRTAKGHSFTCDAHSFVIGGNSDILPKTAMYVANMTEQTWSDTKVGVSQHTLDFQPIPYIYLSFGSIPGYEEEGGVIILDLVSPMLGIRGSGDEVFVLEDAMTYRKKLSSACVYAEPEYNVLRIETQSEFNKKEPEELAMRVLGRLEAICAGEEEYCRYCGKAGAKSRCSSCKKMFCGKECQVASWKYHKVWCKVDAKK